MSIKNHNKSNPDSPVRKEYEDKIDAFYESNGFIDWEAIGASNYIRYYHDLNEYAAKYTSDVSNSDSIDSNTLVSFLGSAKEPLVRKSRYVITCAMKGWNLDTLFIQSLLNFCEINDAQLLIAPRAMTMGELTDKVEVSFLDENAEVVDMSHLNNVDYFEEIESLSDRITIIKNSISLNEQLTFLDVFLNPKIANPISPMKSIGSKMGSVILASPKQVMEAVPSSKNKLPYILMTTGCINAPQYQARKYQTAQEVVAEFDHNIGAVVVEIEDENYFHFRHIRANEDGSFTDYGTLYSADSKHNDQTDAMVLGDWHSGFTDTIAASAIEMIAKELKPKSVVLHDLIDGHSINHHEKDDIVSRVTKYYMGKLDVLSEMAGVAHDLNWLSSLGMKPIVVKSNHDDFIEKYLNSKAWVSDPSTYLLFSQLAATQSYAAFTGVFVDLAYEAVAAACKIKNVKMPNAQWLKRDIDFEINGIDVSHHGDKIANGRPSSMMSISRHLGKCITGHTHSPAIFRDAYRVGTSSQLDLNYNKGPSNWLHTLCLIYKDGSVQLINIIDGRYRIGKKATKPAKIASNKNSK